MNWREIASRCTGFSTPIFGASWNPVEADRRIARDLIGYLEDRRVLFNPAEMECAHHCVDSVIEIREFLTKQLARTDGSNELALNIRSMRTACRKFLDRIGHYSKRHDLRRFPMTEMFEFASALGELRGVFSLQIAALASGYGIDVEDDLASILPAADEDSKVVRRGH